MSMQTILRKITLFSLFVVFCIPHSSYAAAEQRIALVIGNSAYSSGPLKNPVNDATDIAAALQRLGFQVILKKNANLETMEGVIEDFGNRLKRGGVGLFYYAGHGVQVNGINYLIPVNAKINKESDVRYKAVDVGRILDEMANANNGMNIVLLDACRDNPFGKSFRSASRGLAIVSNSPSGSFISYSTSPGQVASDGEGKNSPYTRALLENISQPGLTINKVFMNVRSKVKKETGQVPWELSSLEGDFYFRTGSAKTAVDKSETKEAQAKLTKKEEVEKEVQTLETSSFADLKKKMEAKREKESQCIKDFEDAKKIEEESSSMSEKIQVWQQFSATLTEEHTTRIDEIRQYASNRLEKLVRLSAAGKTLPREIKNDGRFVAYDDGTVLDTKTNLMWASRDNGSVINWHQAKSYCENNRGGGYTDWRLPTQHELTGLFDSSKARPGPCDYQYPIHVATELIEITCFILWATETYGVEGGDFSFYSGRRDKGGQPGKYYERVLPVRSGK